MSKVKTEKQRCKSRKCGGGTSRWRRLEWRRWWRGGRKASEEEETCGECCAQIYKGGSNLWPSNGWALERLVGRDRAIVSRSRTKWRWSYSDLCLDDYDERINEIEDQLQHPILYWLSNWGSLPWLHAVWSSRGIYLDFCCVDRKWLEDSDPRKFAVGTSGISMCPTQITPNGLATLVCWAVMMKRMSLEINVTNFLRLFKIAKCPGNPYFFYF